MGNKQRVSTCKHTKNEVVQIKDGKNWLCLHNDTIEEDIKDAKQIKKLLINNLNL